MTDSLIPESIPERLWHKSRHSGGNSECVEVAGLTDGGVAVRDSKNCANPVLRFTPTGWAAFLDGVRAGRLD